MKKITRLITNVYRICFANPAGRKQYISQNAERGTDEKILSESIIRRIMMNDPLQVEEENHIREKLRQKVKNNRHRSEPVKNSLFEMIVPLFSRQHVEMKMAAISLLVLLLIGLGPRNSQAPYRRMNLFFLADTLGDTISLRNPAERDTVFRTEYK